MPGCSLSSVTVKRSVCASMENRVISSVEVTFCHGLVAVGFTHHSGSSVTYPAESEPARPSLRSASFGRSDFRPCHLSSSDQPRLPADSLNPFCKCRENIAAAITITLEAAVTRKLMQSPAGLSSLSPNQMMKTTPTATKLPPRKSSFLAAPASKWDFGRDRKNRANLSPQRLTQGVFQEPRIQRGRSVTR
ncbi:MAG: hypothetical protein RL077_3670 [Verrucomicrobiota bacterium]